MSLSGSVSAEVDVSGALSFLEGTIAVPVSVSGSLGYTAMVAATDTSGCNLELDVSGSLTVAPLVVPPPAIFGS